MLFSTRGKEILEQFSKPRFCGVQKSRAFLRRTEEKGLIFKLRKKRGIESCSNISFPLIK